MNRRQKIIVSVVGIFLVLLILVGLTYAYFLTKIQGNSNSKSITVSTANLALVYGDGTPEILTSDEAIVPSNTPIGTKTFTVTNTGNATIEEYGVYLEDFKVEYVNEFTDGDTTISAGTPTSIVNSKDMKIVITCTSSISGKTCDGLDGTLPTSNSVLIKNSIEKNEVQTYEMTLTFLETGKNQSEDMNKLIEGKIQIYNEEDVVNLKGTVTGATTGDYVQINSEPKKSQIINGTYKITAVEAGTHMLSVRSSDGTVRGTKTITIKKGDKASVNDSTITIDKKSETATVNITNIESDLGISIESTVKESSPFKEGTLAYTIYENAKNAATENSTTRTVFSESPLTTPGIEASGSDEKTLSMTEDDFGNSYYYRGGGVIDNYLNLGETCWRIIRIDGNKNVKLILDDKDHSCDSTNHVSNNAFLGYAYYYQATKIYKTFIEGGTVETYEYNSISDTVSQTYDGLDETSRKYIIEDAKWCMENEDILYDSNGVQLEDGADTYEAYYNTAVRLFGIGQEVNATLKCFGEYSTKISYYMTLDEAVFTGKIKGNSTSWLPGVTTASYYYNTGYAWQLDSSFNYNDGDGWPYGVSQPIIIINGETPIISTSDGTLENPYTIS